MPRRKHRRFKYAGVILALLGILMTLCACSTQSRSASVNGIDFDDLSKTGSLELIYAQEFSVDSYGDYQLVTIEGDARYLLVPEGAEIPSHLPEDVTALQLPITNAYLVSTSAYDLVREIGALSQIALIGSKSSDIYIDEVKEAVANGSIQYAGKYSAPDFELILSESCDLAIENTMLLHSPEVKEKLEELGIPVMIEHSSYEKHPLGRLEWIKFYGVLLGKEAEANAFFEQQLQELSDLMGITSGDATENASAGEEAPSIAYFSLNTSGTVTVRKPGDYIASMIEMAGGSYALNDLLVEEENALSTMTIDWEDFYSSAKEADVLIYNSTIEGEISSIQLLLEKNQLFADFKAVQTGQVYCTSKNAFQESTGIGGFLKDLYLICHGEESQGLTYLKKL